MPPSDETAGAQPPQLVVPWEQLPDDTRRRWLHGVTHIALPPLLLELHELGADPDEFNPDRVAALLARDPLLGGKLLAVANSAAMGQSQPVTTLDRAVITLGYNIVQAIIVAYGLEAILRKWPDYPQRHFQFVRRVSAAAALLAAEISTQGRLRSAKLLGTAALLSRLGALVIGLTQPAPELGYRQIPNEVLRVKYEQDLWGISTPVLSGQLIRHWGIPDPVPTLVERHCEPLFVELEPGREQLSSLVLATATVLAAPFVTAGQLEPFALLDRYAYEQLKHNLREHRLWDPVCALAGHKRLKRELTAVTE